jgi:hypothetical protein
MAAAHRSREAQQHAIGRVGEHAVREAGDRVASCSTSGRAAASPASAPGTDANPPNPSTTSGARRRMILRLCQQAPTSANGPSTAVCHPLPRMPRNVTPSNSTPCRRTSAPSMPSRVPSQNKRQPRATSFAATANPETRGPRTAGRDHYGAGHVAPALRAFLETERSARLGSPAALT